MEQAVGGGSGERPGLLGETSMAFGGETHTAPGRVPNQGAVGKSDGNGGILGLGQSQEPGQNQRCASKGCAGKGQEGTP